MKTIARFAIDKRWYVIAGWIAFVALTQIITGGLGGSAYKDTFSLPGTETDKVVHLLDKAGHADQNGAIRPGLSCTRGQGHWRRSRPGPTALSPPCAQSTSEWSAWRPHGETVTCADGRTVTGAGQPTLLSADKTIAIADVTWKSANYDQKLFDGVYDQLSTLRSDALQVEFTGDHSRDTTSRTAGCRRLCSASSRALVILAIVFRTVGATALPLASAAAALTAGLGLIGMLSHAMSVSNITPRLPS